MFGEDIPTFSSFLDFVYAIATLHWGIFGLSTHEQLTSIKIKYSLWGRAGMEIRY